MSKKSEISLIDIEIEGLERCYHNIEIIKGKEDYKINRFFIKTNNQEYKKVINDVIDRVIVGMQMKTELLIEQYNYYLYLFAEDIDSNVHCEIEKDIYVARKIVIKEKMPDKEQILNRIKLSNNINDMKEQSNIEVDLCTRKFLRKEKMSNLTLKQINSIYMDYIF